MSEEAGVGGMRAEVESALARRAPRVVPEEEAARRAAVTLLLRPRDAGPAVLLVHRADVDGDPWSGHVALPGGTSEPGDRDLLETARRELLEETGLSLSRRQYLGALDDIHPRTRALPSIAVTPFVAWRDGPAPVRANPEVQAHIWVPFSALRDPACRSELRLGREGLELRFPTIEFEGYTIWGMTFEIISGLLARLDERR